LAAVQFDPKLATQIAKKSNGTSLLASDLSGGLRIPKCRNLWKRRRLAKSTFEVTSMPSWSSVAALLRSADGGRNGEVVV
jgi:hypothetical protein